MVVHKCVVGKPKGLIYTLGNNFCLFYTKDSKPHDWHSALKRNRLKLIATMIRLASLIESLQLDVVEPQTSKLSSE